MERQPITPLHKTALQTVNVMMDTLARILVQQIDSAAPRPDGDGWKYDPMQGCWTRETKETDST